MHINLYNLCCARDAQMFCKSFRKALFQRQNKVANNSLIQYEDLFFFRNLLVLGTKIAKRLGDSVEKLFLQKTSFVDGNFCANLHKISL